MVFGVFDIWLESKLYKAESGYEVVLLFQCRGLLFLHVFTCLTSCNGYGERNLFFVALQCPLEP